MIPAGVKLVGSVPGEFPVDSFSPVFLEVSRGLRREDLSGRFNTVSSLGDGVKYDAVWHPTRAIPLPLYETDASLDAQSTRRLYHQLVKRWTESPIPDNLPCAAVAIKAHGNYCDVREAQWIVVALLWPMNVARILSLEYFEGALEDCISPEWYINASRLMPIRSATQRMTVASRNLPNWNMPSLSISTQPSFLGESLARGTKRDMSRICWKYEWSYDKKSDFVQDLRMLLEDLQKLLTEP